MNFAPSYYRVRQVIYIIRMEHINLLFQPYRFQATPANRNARRVGRVSALRRDEAASAAQAGVRVQNLGIAPR